VQALDAVGACNAARGPADLLGRPDIGPGLLESARRPCRAIRLVDALVANVLPGRGGKELPADDLASVLVKRQAHALGEENVLVEVVQQAA
jgi:hypothetical protein